MPRPIELGQQCSTESTTQLSLHQQIRALSFALAEAEADAATAYQQPEIKTLFQSDEQLNDNDIRLGVSKTN